MTKPDMLESFNLEPNGRHRGLAARCGPLGASREQSLHEPPTIVATAGSMQARH